MFPRAVVATQLLAIFTIGTCIAVDCNKRPSEVTSLLSLELSILCDEYNIQSLTQAFFPANRRQAFVVQVHYYINTTIHPLFPGTEETDKNDTSRPDYVFLWFSSSVLAFIEPRLLTGLSFRSFVADLNHAHIRIEPFFSDDEQWIRSLLSNATIWLKSYAVNRLVSVTEGVSLSYQGFSAYKPDIDKDDYFIDNPPLFYQVYVLLLGSSFFFIGACVCVIIPLSIHHYFPMIHELSERKRHKNVKFKFHNLFWGLVQTFGIIFLAIYAYSIWHIITFGLKWDTKYYFIYPLLITGLIVVIFLGLISSFLIVSKAIKHNTLIRIPRILYSVFGLNSDEQPTVGSWQRIVLILWQGYGVFVTVVSTVLILFSLCGILLALFVDPVAVITTVAIYISTFLSLVYAFAIIFEATDAIKRKNDSNRSKFELYLKLLLLSAVLIFLLLFVIVFGFTYATIVFFAGSSDQINLFSSVGELLPVIVASGIGWLLRHELMAYFTNDSTTTTTTAIAANHNTTTSEMKDMTLTTDVNVNLRDEKMMTDEESLHCH